MQRVYWQQDFRRSDSLYLLDGARVIYEAEAGILYEQQMIRDNFPILEKSSEQFQNLPVGELVEFTLDSADQGLFSFLELRFFREGRLLESFIDPSQKSLSFRVPDYDDFRVRIRIRGAGRTRLLSVTARLPQIQGLIYAGDSSLTDSLGLWKVDGRAEGLLITFSDDSRYLLAEFYQEAGPQIHFASLDGHYDLEIISNYLKNQAQRNFRIFNSPRGLLSKLKDYATITAIE